MNWVAAAIAITCIAAFVWAIRYTEHKWISEQDNDDTDMDNPEPITDIDHEK